MISEATTSNTAHPTTERSPPVSATAPLRITNR